jgi:pyruvate dehydrogenase (quinone)
MLLPLVKRNQHRRFLKKAQKSMKSWNELLEKEGTSTEMPMKPQWLAGSFRAHAGECDYPFGFWNEHHGMGSLHASQAGPDAFLLGKPGDHGVRAAVRDRAQVAFPERQVIGVVGDGAFTMLMGEIITAVAYKLPIKIVIIKNNTLGQIKWEQMVFQGNPEYQRDLLPIDFVALAEAVGARGVRIEDPRTAGAKFDEALAIPGPVIIEAVVDQFTAMLPAKITAVQAAKLSQALAKGQPDRLKIALTAAKDTVRVLNSFA